MQTSCCTMKAQPSKRFKLMVKVTTHSGSRCDNNVLGIEYVISEICTHKIDFLCFNKSSFTRQRNCLVNHGGSRHPPSVFMCRLTKRSTVLQVTELLGEVKLKPKRKTQIDVFIKHISEAIKGLPSFKERNVSWCQHSCTILCSITGRGWSLSSVAFSVDRSKKVVWLISNFNIKTVSNFNIETCWEKSSKMQPVHGLLTCILFVDHQPGMVKEEKVRNASQTGTFRSSRKV